MGQSFVLANLDKRESVLPDSIGCYAKAVEQGDRVSQALLLLVGSGMGRGGGDFTSPAGAALGAEYLAALNSDQDTNGIVDRLKTVLDGDLVLGRWAGDRVAFVGEYYAPGDVNGQHAADLYADIASFTDIGELVSPYLDVNFLSNLD